MHPLTDNSVLCKTDGEVKLEKSDSNKMCGEHNNAEFTDLSIFENTSCEDTPLFEHNDDYQPAVKKRYQKAPSVEICNNILSNTQSDISFQTEIELSNNSSLQLLIKSTVSLLI